MREPDDHTALVDRFGDTWVRVDEHPGRNGGTWNPLTDGPGWDERARDGVGQPRDWDQVEGYGPFTSADPDRAARALERVLREVESEQV
jgi:hypothetical protein